VLIVGQFIVKLGLIFKTKPGYLNIERDIYALKSCWSFLRAFFETFGIQVYFLWVLQTQKRQVMVEKKNTLIYVPTTIILVASLTFVSFVYLSLNVNVDKSQNVKDPTIILYNFLDSKWGLADLILRVMI
jgi:hypothetical protein